MISHVPSIRFFFFLINERATVVSADGWQGVVRHELPAPRPAFVSAEPDRQNELVEAC